MRRAAALFLASLGACATRAPVDEELPADRSDVAQSLYEQLDLVIARHDALGRDGDAMAEREREDLRRLAHEIAVRIVRIDPNADVRALVDKVEKLGS